MLFLEGVKETMTELYWLVYNHQIRCLTGLKVTHVARSNRSPSIPALIWVMLEMRW